MNIESTIITNQLLFNNTKKTKSISNCAAIADQYMRTLNQQLAEIDKF